MFDAARLVFIDETSANTKMMRLHGRCVRGERLVDHVPQGHWKTITFVAALRRHGMRASQTSSGSMLLVRHPRESTGQIAYLWLKWTLKEKDPELTSARGSYRQLSQLVAKFTKSAAITHFLLT